MLNKIILQKLPDVRAYLAGQPIDRAWLFGSYSRGEDTSDSDVDILVEYSKGARVSLFTISRIMCSLKKILQRPVDLVENGCLLPFAEESVMNDRILIYEREN
ncbi:MAG: nucleotidyltransferase domain-containing protein [Bacteroidaceae bacterium]|nr:nucleotidyltransferase domain-containing protein [Bacteroidaceae bacterium]